MVNQVMLLVAPAAAAAAAGAIMPARFLFAKAPGYPLSTSFSRQFYLYLNKASPMGPRTKSQILPAARGFPCLEDFG